MCRSPLLQGMALLGLLMGCTSGHEPPVAFPTEAIHANRGGDVQEESSSEPISESQQPRQEAPETVVPRGPHLESAEGGELLVEGFPALSADRQRVLVFDCIEYGDCDVSVLSTGNREEQRVTIPAAGEERPEGIEQARALISQGPYMPMEERSVHEPTEWMPECVEVAPCPSYDGSRLSISRVDGRAPVTFRPPRRRLLGQRPNSSCFPEGRPASPFRVRVWIDTTGEFALVTSSYQAFAHGCELENHHHVLRLQP